MPTSQVVLYTQSTLSTLIFPRVTGPVTLYALARVHPGVAVLTSSNQFLVLRPPVWTCTGVSLCLCSGAVNRDEAISDPSWQSTLRSIERGSISLIWELP